MGPIDTLKVRLYDLFEIKANVEREIMQRQAELAVLRNVKPKGGKPDEKEEDGKGKEGNGEGVLIGGR